MLASTLNAGWIAGVSTQWVNNEQALTYHNDGDVLDAVHIRSYVNQTGVTQTVWVTIELWANDEMLDSGGDSVDVEPNEQKDVGALSTCTVHEELPDQVEVRISWGTNAAGQQGSTTLYFNHDG